MSAAKRGGGASASGGGGGGTVVAVVAAPLSNHESFLLILHDAAGRAALLDYLKAGYSEHHLIFWEEATQVYAKLEAQEERNRLAQDMWHRYIKNGSKSQINITEPQRLRLQSAVEQIGQKGARTERKRGGREAASIRGRELATRPFAHAIRVALAASDC